MVGQKILFLNNLFHHEDPIRDNSYENLKEILNLPSIKGGNKRGIQKEGTEQPQMYLNKPKKISTVKQKKLIKNKKNYITYTLM